MARNMMLCVQEGQRLDNRCRHHGHNNLVALDDEAAAEPQADGLHDLGLHGPKGLRQRPAEIVRLVHLDPLVHLGHIGYCVQLIGMRKGIRDRVFHGRVEEAMHHGALAVS